jgi:dTDP-4-dehydrorhamnose 3,5-epimerase-like enzyme
MPEALAVFLPFVDRSDSRGGLRIIEESGSLPFAVKRVYWVYATEPKVSRGFHAHRKLRQICFCVSGTVTMRLFDGRREESVQLSPDAGALLLPPMLWHEMHDFSPDCVVTVLADAEYDETDYIRDRDQFIRHVHSS